MFIHLCIQSICSNHELFVFIRQQYFFYSYDAVAHKTSDSVEVSGGFFISEYIFDCNLWNTNRALV